jgi:predicted RNase H-like nuclease (RuvC/YqgF family)
MDEMSKYIKNSDLRTKIKEQESKIKDYKIKVNFLNSLIITRENKISELEEKKEKLEKSNKEKDIIIGNLLYKLEEMEKKYDTNDFYRNNIE